MCPCRSITLKGYWLVPDILGMTTEQKSKAVADVFDLYAWVLVLLL